MTEPFICPHCHELSTWHYHDSQSDDVMCRHCARKFEARAAARLGLQRPDIFIICFNRQEGRFRNNIHHAVWLDDIFGLSFAAAVEELP